MDESCDVWLMVTLKCFVAVYRYRHQNNLSWSKWGQNVVSESFHRQDL